ncbi:MAG: sensor histidine kinase [Peptoniphilaceae bacterium]
METLKLIIILILTIVLTYLFLEKKKNKRINELIKMIENLNRQDYKINIKQDEFSKLEDDIYKLFLKNVEEKENTDKLYKSQSKNLEDIAHQIKTPITAISFRLENMENSEDVENLKKQISRLNNLTDILLKLSSLDANIGKMKREEMDLEEIVDYSLDILEGGISDKNIGVEKDKLKGKIVGDYYWIGKAIINILKNAIYISENRKIYIYSNYNPLYRELCIEDEAGGIREENINKIFRRFYKSPDSKGFGIGLAMAKTIIEANNGEIEVENTKRGAKFRIKFYKVT